MGESIVRAEMNSTHLLGTTQMHQYSSSISDACCHGEIDKDGTVQIGFLLVALAKPHGQSLHNTTSMHRNAPIAVRSAISRTSTRYRSHWTNRVREDTLVYVSQSFTGLRIGEKGATV